MEYNIPTMRLGNAPQRNGYAGSVRYGLQQFFLNNPDEELTLVDICNKFNCTTRAAQEAVSYLSKQNLVWAETIVRGKGQ